MSIKKISFIIFNFLYCIIGFAQNQSILGNDYFVRESIKYKNTEYLFATKQKQFGYLLKISENLQVDTIATFKTNTSLSGFNKIFIHKNKIYINLDKVKELYINDSVKFIYPKSVYNILCFNLKGKLLWQNHFETTYPFGVNNFKIIPTNKKGIRLGFNTHDQIIINKDTIGTKKSMRKSFFVELNKKGNLIEAFDCSDLYNSSLLYSFKKYRSNQLALMLNHPENVSVSNKEVFNIKNNLFEKYINTNSLNIDNVYVFDKSLYILTIEHQLIKYNGRKLKNQIQIENNFTPESSKKSEITERAVFDNGKYLTYVCTYEIRDKDKRWNDTDSLEKVHFEIRHINKKDMTVYKSYTKILDAKNWTTVTNCGEKEMKVIIDGNYYNINL